MPKTSGPEPAARHSEALGQMVDFGLGGAWGYTSKDLTSPARAGAAGAFTDSTDAITETGFTELRVHGVAGSNGPTMLEHPDALQVAGDGTTMFYRRWSPEGAGGQGVRWRLEAYSWGGLTEAPLASAAWLLLAPFMFYNLAHFALPPAASYTMETAAGADDAPAADAVPVPGGAGPARAGDLAPPQMLSRDRPHAWAQGLLRVLALTATLQFTTATVSILLGIMALQAGQAHFPSWLAWFPKWPPADRVTLALIGVALVITLMWQISMRTAHLYEGRTSQARPAVNRDWPLTQTGFWKGQQLVRRQRSLHAAGAAAVTALVVARPGQHLGAGRPALMWLAALVLAMAVVSICLPLADRQDVTLNSGPEQDRRRMSESASSGRARREQQHDLSAGTWWCRAVLAAGAAVFLGAFFTGGWPAAATSRAIALPGFTNICAYLLAVQALLLVLLGLLIWAMVLRAAAQPPQSRPFAAGHLTTVLAALAVGLGGVFSAVLNLFVARIFGTPVPTGLSFAHTPAHALQIPWPLYVFAAAPAGLVAGLVVAGIWVGVRWWRHAREFAAWSPTGSEVARFYATSPLGQSEPPAYRGRLRSIASAWSYGLLADQAGVVFAAMTAGMVAVTAAAQIAAATAPRHTVISAYLRGLVSAESLVGLFLATMLVALLRSQFTDQTRRRLVGIVWDIATFWPRATHPFAPPCYAERAVPELVDRLRILTGTVPARDDDPAWQQIKTHIRNEADSPRLPAGPVLLTGYSQGSILAPAVVAQLPEPTLARVGLLTLACPARRLYGRAFPAYFGQRSLRTLAGLLEVTVPAGDEGTGDVGTGDGGTGHDGTGDVGTGFTGGRWKNLVRPTDYIGSYVFRKPGPARGDDPAALQPGVDQPCWDPVSLAADIDPTPPAVHRHTGFWPDPRVTQVGLALGQALCDRPAGPPKRVGPPGRAVPTGSAGRAVPPGPAEQAGTADPASADVSSAVIPRQASLPVTTPPDREHG